MRAPAHLQGICTSWIGGIFTSLKEESLDFLRQVDEDGYPEALLQGGIVYLIVLSKR
ncbi:hypothetical protein NNL21_21425 [Paenibacillus mendelii]|nr:hypothetical protein [Paenibacillus mendelii]